MDATRAFRQLERRALIDMGHPPRQLLLGSDALRLVTDSRAEVDAERHPFDALSPSTDIPDGA
jgi:hypothetical protein